jgi:hypothetical protein
MRSPSCHGVVALGCGVLGNPLGCVLPFLLHRNSHLLSSLRHVSLALVCHQRERIQVANVCVLVGLRCGLNKGGLMSERLLNNPGWRLLSRSKVMWVVEKLFMLAQKASQQGRQNTDRTHINDLHKIHQYSSASSKYEAHGLRDTSRGY